MLFHLISVLSSGAFIALCAFLISRSFKSYFPKYLIPILAGAGMIVYSVWSEYSWATNTAAKLPEHVKVAKTYSSKSYFSPWTFVFPRTDRMTLVDISKIRRNDDYPDIVIAELILMKRFAGAGRIWQLFDCKERRQADIIMAKDLNPDELVKSAQWNNVSSDDMILSAACEPANAKS